MPRRPRTLPPAPRPTLHAERYARRLRALVERMREETLDDLVRAYEQADALRQDDDRRVLRWLERVIGPLTIRWGGIFEEAARSIAGEEGEQLSIWQASGLAEDLAAAADSEERRIAVRRALAIDVLGAEPWIAPILEAWNRSNVDLIKSIPRRHHADVERVMMAEWRQGTHAMAMVKKLEQRFGVTASRAELIARDQMGKLNGKLSMLRQTTLGIERYVWTTSMDERVRSSHRQRHGQTYAWREPPPDGHPGYPIQCRCTARGVVDDVWEAMDREAAAGGGNGLVAVQAQPDLFEQAARRLGAFAESGVDELAREAAEVAGSMTSSATAPTATGRGRRPRVARPGRTPRGGRR